MKLELFLPPQSPHTGLVSAVGWNSSNELYTCSDDQTIWRWNRRGEVLNKVCTSEASVTDIQWFPSMSQRHRSGAGTDIFVVGCTDAFHVQGDRSGSGTDIFVVGALMPSMSQRHRSGARTDIFVLGCTDGAFYIMSKGGREEKRVEAHEGAVICIRWSFEGTALATGGEDGALKIWSRSGIHRCTLAQHEQAIYALAWSPDSDQIVSSCGPNLSIKPIQLSLKQVQWVGHDGLVLKVDWNPTNNSIISAGEDCHYKVWDCYGRQLYQSPKGDFPITSLAWCPSGEVFVVGSFNSLILCDKTGWLDTREKPNSGSLLSIAWSLDGTQIAGVSGNGTIIFGQLVHRMIEWNRITATLKDYNCIVIQDIMSETFEELDFRDQVIKFSLCFQHLVVVTAMQCYIYAVANWHTPQILDIDGSITLLKQCENCFLFVSCLAGLQLFTYGGRRLSNPKFQGLSIESVNDKNISLSNDVLAMIDHNDKKMIRFLDVTSGKMVGEAVHVALEVVEIALSQGGMSADRKLFMIDANRDLYITPILMSAVFKLATMVNSCMWNEVGDILVAVADERLVVWYYPHVAYVDKDLLQYVKIAQDRHMGKRAKLQSFYGPRCMIRRANGATILVNVSSYPLLLFEHAAANRWDHVHRLCSYMQDKFLWACMAGTAVKAKELNKAKVAYAALDEVDKVHYIIHLQNLATKEAQQAELMLFQRQPKEAESILLQATLTLRAIILNIRLFNWDRALELGLLNDRAHLETVLWYRHQYLQSTKQGETRQQFLRFAQVVINPEHVMTKVESEKKKEIRSLS